jgi:pyruvate-formate lyase
LTVLESALRTPATVPEPYYRPTALGPDCSTPRNARLRQRRFDLAYADLHEPESYTKLAQDTRQVYLDWENINPALGRVRALLHVVKHCEVTLEPDTLFLGGENPFFFNLMLPALQADRYSQFAAQPPEPIAGRLRGRLFASPCFDGHITPGLEFLLGLGITGFQKRIGDAVQACKRSGQFEVPGGEDLKRFYEAAALSCEVILVYTRRNRAAALDLAASTSDPAWADELRQAAAVLERVPLQPAHTLREALQSYWIAYILVTLEMGGCTPGGGLGLGRIDQFLYPFYERDLQSSRLTRAEALELMEQFLLCFRHVDYFTVHQLYTPGSQASLGGITSTGQDAFNELSELILEASLRINMSAPYLSLRLYQSAPPRLWNAAASYVASGLGFPIVNDEVLIPAFLKHGRTLSDARDYICSCCYEHTIPGREAFHPSCCFVNLLMILELALNEGFVQQTRESLGLATPPASQIATFEQLLEAFWQQVHFVFDRLCHLTNAADAAHTAHRRYPLMSLFIDDCLAKGKDVCSGGARYNLTGCVVGGLPNVVNSLAAIRSLVFEQRLCTLAELVEALKANFDGYEKLQRQLLAAPKWGNGISEVDEIAGQVTKHLYGELEGQRNPRGGRWQLGLYSFVANHWMGAAAGASADGRKAGEIITRNLNPSWGSDRHGPTAVLQSLSQIDFSLAPDGCSLDLRFSPSDFATPVDRHKLVGFLKAFVALGVMEMQISVVDTETLIDAQQHPQRYPHLLVRVAGYSARFIDLTPAEQTEIISRTLKRL